MERELLDRQSVGGTMNQENPKKTPATEHNGNLQKDPDDWVTGDEPMTAAQASYLKTLSEEAGTEFSASLSKADASKRIEELQAITGRGLHVQ
jgi:hypothetical protein